MLKQHWKVISALERICDNLVVVACFFVAYYIRAHYLLNQISAGRTLPTGLKALGPLEGIGSYLIVIVVALPLYNAVFSLLGAYRSMRFNSFWGLSRTAFIASCLVFLCVAAVLFMLKIDLSRSFIGLFCATSCVGFVAVRSLVLQVLRYYRAKGKNFRNVLIVGTGEQAAKLFRDIASRPELGIRVRAFVDTQIPGSGIALKRESKAEHPRRMVPLEGFERALKRYTIDEVLFTDVVPAFSVVQELAQIAAEEGIQVSIAADIFSLEIFTSDVSYFGSTPLIHYQPYHATSFGLVFKRLFDFFVSFLLLILFAPVMILTAIAIRLETRGPIFFRQRRVGLNGRQFTLLKFRSMVEGAEEMLSDLLPHNEMSGPAFKMKRDPRVTRVGRFIRRYSIDELPQLLNVLIGDMSLVGPRPPIPAEVSHYQRRQRRRLSMRPGLTCTWQVSGRNKIPDFETWAKLDLEYIDTWSFSNDLKLLLKTIPAVFSGEGAR